MTEDDFSRLKKPGSKTKVHKWDNRGLCTACRLVKSTLTEALGCKKKPHKFGAVGTLLDGISFRSAGEAACYSLHKERELAGEIKDVAVEPTVRFEELGINYKPDGVFTHVKTGETRYWEHKGMLGDRWRLIRKIWRAVGPAPLDVYYQKGKTSYFHETIHPMKEAT